MNDQTADGTESGTSFKQALFAKECGFNLHDTMIWDKGTAQFPETNRYYGAFEYMFIWSKGKPKCVNLLKDKANINAGSGVGASTREPNGELKQTSGAKKGRKVNEYGVRYNVWRISKAHNIETVWHPAVFPYDLARDHILSWSNEGDTVCDPFLGSGTTRLAAYDTRRDFIGFEIDKEYFEKQEARFADYTAQMRLW